MTKSFKPGHRATRAEIARIDRETYLTIVRARLAVLS